MSAAAPSRLMFRHTRFVARQTNRRHASTTEATKDAAAKSKDTVSNASSQASSKASQGFSRVTSSAGPALSGAAQRVGSTISRIGGWTEKLISFVQSLIPPTIYYSKVGFELTKLVFRGQKMSPPDLSAFQRYGQSMMNMLRNPSGLVNRSVDNASSISPENILGRIRNLDARQMATVGIVGAEVLGFFTIGEILGKMKLVGYRGDQEHHEGH